MDPILWWFKIRGSPQSRRHVSVAPLQGQGGPCWRSEVISRMYTTGSIHPWSYVPVTYIRYNIGHCMYIMRNIGYQGLSNLRKPKAQSPPRSLRIRNEVDLVPLTCEDGSFYAE